MHHELWIVGCLAAALLTIGRRPAHAAVSPSDSVLRRIGVHNGVCVVLGDEDASLAIDLARNSELLVYVQESDAAAGERAAAAAHQAGLYGERVFVGRCSPQSIGLADDIADAVIVLGGNDSYPEAELLRVLHPGGKAVVVGGQEREFEKPWPAGIDQWTHHYHGPDNNPQSSDQLARSPYLTQFVAAPRYAPGTQSMVAANGRLFIAFGNVAWHQREEPWLNTLIAVNAFNGVILWKRPLTPGIMVDRNTMIATEDVLYLGDEKSCKVLDAATGEKVDEIHAPAELTDGTFWKWMALQDGVLYALVGEDEPRDKTAKWRRTHHGWPWTGISQGYNEPLYQWGMGRTLLAIDLATKQVRWHHREADRIDSRALCLRNDRIYLMTAPSMELHGREVKARFGDGLACLDATTGKQLWRRTRQKDADVFEAIGPYRPGHGYIGGWKSTVYMKASDQALYLVGPQTEWLTALSSQDGRFLWKYAEKDLHIVIREDGVYTIGPQNSEDRCSKRLDPLTGEILHSYAVSRRACTRSVGGPDGILFRASGGSVRLDLSTGKPCWISPMRPSCNIGVVIANGHLYWAPWVCDCNLQLFGIISLSPAGDFEFEATASEDERLERAEGAQASSLAASPADWPTFRGDNQRRARTAATIPDAVKLAWTAEGAVQPTAPVAAGGLTFVADANGVVRAWDVARGESRWRAFVGGAVHYPPSIADGRAFVGSGDGWLYALDAATGRELWRFRAAPTERRIPVYGRLVSTWPVAGGALVENGVVYFAGGITDFDGTHVYALDAATGEIRWQNNSLGHLDRQSRRGIACQGEMLLHDGKLYLAGGNAVSPAILDAASGECLNSPPDFIGTRAPRGRELLLSDEPGPKGQPGPIVRVVGQPLYSDPENPVFSGEVVWPNPAVTASNAAISFVEDKHADTDQWTLTCVSPDGKRPLWEQPLPGEPVRWGLCVDRDGRVIVVLRDGRVICFS